MTINDMQCVLKIAEEGSFSKAAQALFITQSALSQRLQKVENELGIRLFDRNRFGTATLTKAGQRFCKDSTQILAIWRDMLNDLQDMQGQKEFTMGIPVRSGYRIIAGLLDQLKKECPHVTLTFLDRSNYQMEEMIAKGELDFALIRMPAAIRNAQMRLLYDSYPEVHLRKGSPLQDKVYYHPGDPTPYIDLHDLEGEPLVATPASREHRTRLWTDMLFAQIPGFKPNVLYTVPNVYMMDDYVDNGTASYILTSRTLREGGCRLEPDYSLPYAQYFVQSSKADPQVADSIYRILYRQMNPEE